MINIILAEDHNIVRNGIKILLERDADLRVVAETVNGKEVLKLLQTDLIVNIVVADINMPEMDGITLVKIMKQKYPHIPIIILSMLDNEQYIIEAFKEGASGYLFKNINADELIFALKYVCNGNKYICNELSLSLLAKLMKLPSQDKNQTLKYSFSAREIEILHLMSEGYTNNEMSDKLFISKRTIEGYRQNLLDRTKVKNTAALIKYAVLNGIID
ncbi:response regulator transcription factor [Pedobacter glucosidilyticus]|uniref:response regulator transcription factor n=1 Tax=Pedobacter glucosidilyticus TaxID=1122941 RepID=UPI0003FCC6D4|nr:response regulator transcription factor [Pedobacter glucosidilyticus]